MASVIEIPTEGDIEFLRQGLKIAKTKLAGELAHEEELRAADAVFVRRIHEIQRELAVREPVEEDFAKAQAFFEARKRWRAARPGLEHALAAVEAERRAHSDGPGVRASHRILQVKREIGEAEVAIAEAELHAAMYAVEEKRIALRQAQANLGEVNRDISDSHGGARFA